MIADTILTKGANRERDCVADGRPEVLGQPLELLVGQPQIRRSQVLPKGQDTYSPCGPWITTKDEVPDPHALQLETRVNDDVVQSTSTGDMIFDIPTLIEVISEFITLEPGDVVATGTPAGVGFVRKPPLFLVPGDVCTVSITGLGELANPVVQES